MMADADARRGRPLRFLGVIVGGWVCVRTAMLWPPSSVVADLLDDVAPVAVAAPAPAPAAMRLPGFAAPAAPPLESAANRPTYDRRARVAPQTMVWTTAARGRPPLVTRAPAVAEAPILPGLPLTVDRAAPNRASRWSGSFWTVVRGGSGIAPGALGGQLGGSQTGVRVAYMLDRTHRLALAARFAAPLGAGLREAALGVEWQPTRLPVRLIAEERFALDGGPSGPAIGVVGGFGPIAIPSGFRLEGYGQAGAIRRAGTQAYADGAVHIGHTLTRIGPARIDLGAGAWGAAQRGAARLDVGPSLGLTVPLGKQPVRLRLDWRQRVAGDAHPGSGPALTLGSDF